MGSLCSSDVNIREISVQSEITPINSGSNLSNKKIRSRQQRDARSKAKMSAHIEFLESLRQKQLDFRTQYGDTESIYVPALTNSNRSIVNYALLQFYDVCQIKHNFNNPYVEVRAFDKQINVSGKIGSKGLFF